MKYLIPFTIVLTILSNGLNAQNMEDVGQFAFREIPEYEGDYTSGKVAARMIDGLGFRFYWATESLRNEDMDFRPSEESRSIGETIEHIYGMSYFIMSALNLEFERDEDIINPMDQRNQTLTNLHEIREKLINSGDEDFQNFKRVSQNGDTTPFWNFINGPIEDCVWHAGQIASFRRLSGNPINSNISLFSGKLRNK